MKPYVWIWATVPILLSACSASEEAMFNPEASYQNRQKVSSVNPANSITVIGSLADENGNYMPAYPTMAANVHKIIHISPVPKSLWAQCEQISYSSTAKQTLTGFKSVEGVFKAGKTYQLYCNIQAGNRYRVSVKEVPSNTAVNNRNRFETAKPNDNNRVRLEITGKSSQNWLRLAGGTYMAVRNWDGSLAERAELAYPVSSVNVECQKGRDMLLVSMDGSSLRPNKTYRLDCRYTQEGLMEAYIAESK